MSDVCQWGMGTNCDGEVKEQKMFSSLLVISICDKHFIEHSEVMSCVKYGFDINKIIRWNINIRRRIMKYFNILPTEI